MWEKGRGMRECLLYAMLWGNSLGATPRVAVRDRAVGVRCYAPTAIAATETCGTRACGAVCTVAGLRK